MSSIKAVIFDVDGTLYDYNTSEGYAEDKVCEYTSRRFNMTPSETSDLYYEMLRRQEEELGPTNSAIHSRMIRFQKFLEEIGRPVFPHALNLTKLYWDTFMDTMIAEPGITELMRQLRYRGIHVALGTNMSATIQYEKVERLKLGGYVQTVLTSEEAGAEKPQKEFFDCLTRKINVRPEECVFIGDNAKLDYQGARRAGMHGVWYSRYGGEHKELENSITSKIDSYLDCVRAGEIRLGDVVIN